MNRLYWTVAGCLLAGMGGMLVMLEPLSHRLYWVAAAVGVASAAIGLYARPFQLVRLVADAWGWRG